MDARQEFRQERSDAMDSRSLRDRDSQAPMVVLTEGPGACAWALFHFSLLSRSAALL